MAQPKKIDVDYATMRAELDAIMVELQRDDLDIDVALKQYERGLQIVKTLEDYLTKAENRVKEIKTKFSSP